MNRLERIRERGRDLEKKMRERLAPATGRIGHAADDVRARLGLSATDKDDWEKRLRGFLKGLDEFKKRRDEAKVRRDDDEAKKWDDAYRGSCAGIRKWLEGEGIINRA